MKKTITMVILAALSITACKKKETDAATAPQAAATPSQSAFTQGTKITDNKSQTTVADSSYFYIKGTTPAAFTAYKGEMYPNTPWPMVYVTFKSRSLRITSYPIDSLDLESSNIIFAEYTKQYSIKGGNFTITSLNDTKASGTFSFTILNVFNIENPSTSVTGEFKDVKIKK